MRRFLLLVFISVLFLGCALGAKKWLPQNALRHSVQPLLDDDGDSASLLSAIDNSLKYFRNRSDEELVNFGSKTARIAEVRESLTDFKSAVQKYGLNHDLFEYVNQNFNFYRTAAQKTLFTGYYQVLLRGSKTKTSRYRYPLYRRPKDLITIDLSKFFSAERLGELPKEIRARLAPGLKLLPYYTRREIDGGGTLHGKKLELCWVDNLFDLFSLHIQGSGVVELPDGSIMRVSYSDKNGQPYVAIGKLLIERGILRKHEVSMQKIREYVEQNPDAAETLLYENPSYVFFEEVKEGPRGSLGVPVTPGRSIATDKNLFPRGALAFISTQKPVIKDGAIIDWEPFYRFVLNQDTGGAITGPGRVDVFTGYGQEAELFAGSLKHPGSLFFLLKK